MIKYEVKKIPYVEGFIMIGYEYKTVSKSEFQLLKDEGWILHRKKYIIITRFTDWWKLLTTGNKIAVFAIIVPVLFAVLAWIF